MSKHRNVKSRYSRSYNVVKEGSKTQRPNPPGEHERKTQNNDKTASVSDNEGE